MAARWREAHRSLKGKRKRLEKSAPGFWLLACLVTMCGGALAQDQPSQPAPPVQETQPSNPPLPENPYPQNPEPQKPEPQKKDESNPARKAADATKRLGEATFVKVRDWESGWLTGPYIGRDRDRVPLTGQQRQQIYVQQTFTTPSSYLKRMFVAGVDQLRHSPPQWPQGWTGYGERFASREGQFFAANSLAALSNAALRYEPRYDECHCKGFRLRTQHAILRNFLTYDHSENAMRPQWGLYAGAFGGGLISTAWKPHPRNAFAEGGRAMLGQAAYGTLLNFFTEFAGEINRKLGAKR